MSNEEHLPAAEHPLPDDDELLEAAAIAEEDIAEVAEGETAEELAAQEEAAQEEVASPGGGSPPETGPGQEVFVDGTVGR